MEKLIELLKNLKPNVDFENAKDLIDDGILDSLEIVEIITMIEEKFAITIDPDAIDPDNFQSAQDMWKMIEDAKL